MCFGSVREKLFDRPPKEDLDGELCVFVFVGRFLEREFPWPQTASRPDDFEPCLERKECGTVHDVDEGSSAGPAGVLLEGRLEGDFPEMDTWQSASIQFFRQDTAVNPRRSEHFERAGGAASLGQVRSFEEAYSGIR